MFKARIPKPVGEYLASLHTHASGIPPSPTTRAEFETDIDKVLLFVQNEFKRFEGQKAIRGDNPKRIFGLDPKRDALAVLEKFVPPKIAKSLVAEVVDMLERLPKNDGRMPYEFWVLALNLQVIRYTAQSHFPRAPLPWIDLSGIGHVNANFQTFGNDSVLVFQSGTKAFTNLISKAFVAVFGEFSKIVHGHPEFLTAERIPKILQDIKATKAFGAILHAYLFRGNPVAGPFVALDEKDANMANHLETAMDRFLVAHEYAHILKGHRPGDQQQYQNELEADRIGLGFMLESMAEWGTKDNVVSFCGAYLIIGLQELIMRTVSKIQGRPYSPAPYPSSFHRCVNLLATCERNGMLTMPMEQVALGQGVQLMELYKIVEPGLLDEAKKGRPLASIWI